MRGLPAWLVPRAKTTTSAAATAPSAAVPAIAGRAALARRSLKSSVRRRLASSGVSWARWASQDMNGDVQYTAPCQNINPSSRDVGWAKTAQPIAVPHRSVPKTVSGSAARRAATRLCDSLVLAVRMKVPSERVSPWMQALATVSDRDSQLANARRARLTVICVW